MSAKSSSAPRIAPIGENRDREGAPRATDFNPPNALLAVPAFLALLVVSGLAFFPDARLLPPAEMGPEKLTLLFVAVCFLVALIPAWERRLVEDRNAATWAVLVASVLLFHLADRAGPRAGEGFGLQWSLTPDDAVPVSYATRAVILGALLSAGAWVRGGAPERAFAWGLLLVGVLGAGAFWVLSRFYTVGVVETLDPTPLGTLAVQVVAYGCLALCARAATATPLLRRALLKIVPVVLLAVWARHQLAPLAAPVETE